MLILSEKEINEINLFIQEMPVKYGLPLINYLNLKIQEQKTENIVQESSETTN